MNIKKLPKSAIVVTLFLLSSLFQLIPIYLFKYDTSNITANQKFVLTAFSTTTTLIILIIIYFKSIKEDFKKLKTDLYKNMEIAFKYWLVGLLIMVTSNVLITLFLSKANAGNEEAVQEIIKSTGYLTIIIIGIFAPIVEELVFRRAFKDFFTNKTLFIIASGLVFGGLHVFLSLNSLWDLFYLIPYCSLGIAFSCIYAKTDNIFSSIIMHAFHNTVFTLFSIISAGVILW